MRELAVVGSIALSFGLGAYYALGSLGAFSIVNLIGGGLALLFSAVLSLRHWRGSQPGTRGPALDALLTVLAIVWGVVLVERFAAYADLRMDWTFEGRYELAPATRSAVANLPSPAVALFFHDSLDPRTRRTRLLLDELARYGDVEVRMRELDVSPEEEDRFGVSSSNTVVFEMDGRFETVVRPTEGALFEALSRLGNEADRIVYVTVGTGEGDVENTSETGFSGFAAALETEGFRVRTLSTAFVEEIPPDADLLVAIAPERTLRAESLEALRRYLARGGRLMVFLEPGRQSGIEEVLAEYGLRSPDALVVDPASGPVDGDTPGLSPIAFSYSEHPVTRGLNSNRMTFFRRARSFELRKPRPDDRLTAVVYASGESWLDPDPVPVDRTRRPVRPATTRADYHPLVVSGEYLRGGEDDPSAVETRIVAFGDADIASNRYLRALFNLDLVMNAAHWATERASQISIRPKGGQVIQFPVPIQNSLRALYGVGLLVPELALAVGALIWMRRRAA